MNQALCASSLIAIVALLAGPAAAQSAFKLQPGLWEQSMTMKTTSGEMEARMAQMQQQMASMPPERRKMIEDMMAKQGVGIGGGSNSVRLCVSPEQAARGDMPQHDGHCKQEMLERSGSTIRYRFSCTGPRPTTGEGEYTMTSPTAYNGRASVVTQVKGKPEKVDMTQQGHWVSADCGNIKPLQLNKP